MKAIILLKIRFGEANNVCAKFNQMKSILDSRVPFGQYDAAVMIQGESLEEFWDVIKCQLQTISGVIEIFPCLILDDQSFENLPEHLQELVLLPC